MFINFLWPGNLMVTDVPRRMSLYRFPGFVLLSCLLLYIIVTEIVPYLYIQNKIIRIRIRIGVCVYIYIIIIIIIILYFRHLSIYTIKT